MTGSTGGASLDVYSIDWGSIPSSFRGMELLGTSTSRRRDHVETSLGEVREILDGSQDGDAGDQSMATGPTDLEIFGRPPDEVSVPSHSGVLSLLDRPDGQGALHVGANSVGEPTAHRSLADCPRFAVPHDGASVPIQSGWSPMADPSAGEGASGVAAGTVPNRT